MISPDFSTSLSTIKAIAGLRCVESVQIRRAPPREPMAVQVLCGQLCLILLGKYSYLVESYRPDQFEPAVAAQPQPRSNGRRAGAAGPVRRHDAALPRRKPARSGRVPPAAYPSDRPVLITFTPSNRVVDDPWLTADTWAG